MKRVAKKGAADPAEVERDEMSRCYKKFAELLEIEKEGKKPSKELRYCTTRVPWAMWERAAKIRSKTLQREIEQFPMRKWLLYVANHYRISLEEAYLKIVRVMKPEEVRRGRRTAEPERIV